MKILIFAHNGNSGGAEHALRRLIDLMKAQHEIHVVLPFSDGSEHTHYRSLGIPCYQLPIPLCLPNFSGTVLQYAQTDFNNISSILQNMQFDLAISNTIATLHGGIISKHLGIPHLTYAHEFPGDELMPNSVSRGHYIQMLEELSAGIISCSRFVSKQFSANKRATQDVLVPFDYSTASTPARSFPPESDFVIQVIGARSIRKNMHFAVTLTKSLELIGIKVRLDIIGQDHTGSAKLGRALEKRRINHRIVGYVPNPCAINLQERVVTLVCSTTEPYGLTIPESLRIGVPVLATRSGGPEEILPEEYLFDPDDLDDCARKIRHVFNSYGEQVQESQQIYTRLQRSHTSMNLASEIDAALHHAKSIHEASSPSSLMDLIGAIRQGLSLPINAEIIASNIAATKVTCGSETTPADVLQSVEHDVKHPGSAVLEDIKNHDVTPFAMSKRMDDLYKNGLGLSIELASTYNDPGRLQMASFIICALQERQIQLGRPMKILALGDGIGIDTIRLAVAGFSVDYIDYDQSNMSRIAELNFQSSKDAIPKGSNIKVIKHVHDTYDALICLEVIEHVPDPMGFASALHGYLNDDGLLCISECFNGVEGKWPTHLYSNEKYSGLLPFMLFNQFKLAKTNTGPYGKPYIFSKRGPGEPADALGLLMDRSVMNHLISNQMDIGF